MSLLYSPMFYTAEHYLRFKNPTEEHYRGVDFLKTAATPTIAMVSSAALGALISQQIIARTGITVGMFFLGAATPVAVATAVVGIAYAAGAKEAIINCFWRVAAVVTRSVLHAAIDNHRLPNIVKILAGQEMATLVSSLQTNATDEIKTLINNIVTADNLKKLYTDRKTAVMQILKANGVAGPLQGVLGKALSAEVKAPLLGVLPQFMVTETTIKVKDADGRKILETAEQTAARVANEKTMLALVESLIQNGNAEISALIPHLVTQTNITKYDTYSKAKSEASKASRALRKANKALKNMKPEDKDALEAGLIAEVNAAKAQVEAVKLSLQNALNELIAEMPGIAGNPAFMNALNGVVGKVLGDPVKELLLTILPQFMVTDTPIKVKNADGRKVLETPEQTATRVANEKTMLALVESLIQNGNAEITTLLSKLLTVDNINNLPALKTKYDAYTNAAPENKVRALNELIAEVPGIAGNPAFMNALNGVVGKVLGDPVKESLLTILPQFMVTETPIKVKNADGRKVLETPEQTATRVANEKTMLALVESLIQNGNAEITTLLSKVLTVDNINNLPDIKTKYDAYTNAAPENKVRALNELIAELPGIAGNPAFMNALNGVVGKVLGDPVKESLLTILPQFMVTETPIKVKNADGRKVLETPEQTATRVANEKTMLALVESLIQNGNAEIATLLSKLLTVDNINNLPALKTKYDAYSKAAAGLKADKDNAEKKAALQTAQDELFNLLQGIISKKELIDSVNAIIAKIFTNANEQPAFKENFDKFLRSFLQTRPDTHKFAYADKAFADLIIKALEDMEFQANVPELLSTILDPMVLPQIMELLPEAMAYLKAESPVDEVKALPPLLNKVGPLLSFIEHDDSLKQKLFGFIFALIPPLKDNPEELIEYIRSSLILSEPQIKEIERLKEALAANAPERDAVRVNRDLHSSGLRRLLQTYHDAHEDGKFAQALQAAKVKVLGELETEKVDEDKKNPLREALQNDKPIMLSKSSEPSKTLKSSISEYNALQEINALDEDNRGAVYIAYRKAKLQSYIDKQIIAQSNNIRVADAIGGALQNEGWREDVLSGVQNVLTGLQGSVGEVTSLYADYAQHNVDTPKENLPAEVKERFNSLVLQKPELMQALRATLLTALTGSKPIATAYTEGTKPHIAYILLAKNNPSYNNFAHAFETELGVDVLRYLLEEYVKSGDPIEVLRSAMKDQDKGPKVKRFIDKLCQNQGREVADPVWLFQVLVSPWIPIETARDLLLRLGANNVDHALDVVLQKSDAAAEPDFKVNEPEPAPSTFTKMGNIATGLFGIAKRAASAPLQTAYASTNIGFGLAMGAARSATQALGDKFYGNKAHQAFLKLAEKKSAQYVARIDTNDDQNIPETALVLDIKNCTISDALNIPQGLNLGVLKISNTTINIFKLMTLLNSNPAIVEFSKVEVKDLTLDALTEQMAVELSKYIDEMVIDERLKTRIESLVKWHNLKEGFAISNISIADLNCFITQSILEQNQDRIIYVQRFGPDFKRDYEPLYKELANLEHYDRPITGSDLNRLINNYLTSVNLSSQERGSDDSEGYGTPLDRTPLSSPDIIERASSADHITRSSSAAMPHPNPAPAVSNPGVARVPDDSEKKTDSPGSHDLD